MFMFLNTLEVPKGSPKLPSTTKTLKQDQLTKDACGLQTDFSY